MCSLMMVYFLGVVVVVSLIATVGSYVMPDVSLFNVIAYEVIAAGAVLMGLMLWAVRHATKQHLEHWHYDIVKEVTRIKQVEYTESSKKSDRPVTVRYDIVKGYNRVGEYRHGIANYKRSRTTSSSS